MTWALYTTWEDATEIEKGFQETGLTGPLRTKLRGYLDGGLRDWRITGVCIPPEHPCFYADGVSSGEMGHCAIVVPCTFGTLSDFRSLLRALIGKNPGAEYYRWFEPFLGDTGGGQWAAVDPYPPPPGYFTGMFC